MTLALMIVSVLFLVSEYLASTEKFKANSIVQAITNFLKSAVDALTPKK